MPATNVLRFPCAERLDVRAALLEGLSTPQVPRPHALDAAIDARARVLADQAYDLCREHLRRRVAFRVERGYPKRTINTAEALRVIKEGDLGDALVHVYSTRLRYVMHKVNEAAEISERFLEVAQKVHEVVDSHE